MTRKQRQNLQLPKENKMHPRDKYTVFSRYSRNHRKSVHKVCLPVVAQ